MVAGVVRGRGDWKSAGRNQCKEGDCVFEEESGGAWVGEELSEASQRTKMARRRWTTLTPMRAGRRGSRT